MCMSCQRIRMSQGMNGGKDGLQHRGPYPSHKPTKSKPICSESLCISLASALCLFICIWSFCVSLQFLFSCCISFPLVLVLFLVVLHLFAAIVHLVVFQSWFYLCLHKISIYLFAFVHLFVCYFELVWISCVSLVQASLRSWVTWPCAM